VIPAPELAAMTTTSRASEPAAGAIRFPRMDASFTARLSAGAYQTLANLVYQHSRIWLGPDKQPMLANRLRRRLRALGLACYDDYCAVLRSEHGPEEVEHLVDLISTNHTKFFREPEHFSFLTNRVLPELAPRLAADGSPLRLWSAAASSGEEPYTLAIVLAEFCRQWPALDWQVEASDISHRMLDHARAGIYPLDRVPPAFPEILKRYFQKGVGARAGTCRVKPELRERVRFQRINLFQAEYPVPRDQHVIFCRNVMIYFDAATQKRVLERIHAVMKPKGLLYVGHSENFSDSRELFRLRGKTIYERV
jgi:chemotaxis protein methyltransferase CheR